MKLVVGLGNPEEKYKNTRHNVGFLILDRFQGKSINGVVFKKSSVFMNDSGSFVLENIKKYKVKNGDLYVVHDDLDIGLGEYKIQKGKGPKDHNGLNDIYEKIGSNEFWHVRVGVENRDPKNKIPGKDYVLENFTEEEKLILERSIKEICKKLETL